MTPGTSATRIGTTPSSGVSVAIPRPSTTVSGRLMSIVRSTPYTPGVRIRFLPRASSVSIRCAESDGRATKKSLIGSECPGVAAVCHVVPRESDCASGTKTRRSPPSST
jgi:hypothetical protein